MAYLGQKCIPKWIRLERSYNRQTVRELGLLKSAAQRRHYHSVISSVARQVDEHVADSVSVISQ